MAIAVEGRSPIGPRLEMGPLIDVSLTLLIVFMVCTPLLQHGYFPSWPHPSGEPEGCGPPTEYVILRMDGHGAVFLDEKPIAAKEIASGLQSLLQRRSGQLSFFFLADTELPYGQVMDFLDLCYRSGVKNLSIVTGDPAW